VLVDPMDVFQDTVLIAVPHMDDGMLACGGTIALLPHKDRLHVVYATDGMGSPAPVVTWRDSASPDLGAVRVKEARAAMGYLDVPDENIHFLGLPDGRLKNHRRALSRLLIDMIGQIEPTQILMPFRYDCHADHLALNHAITAAHRQGIVQADMAEYFVYYRWRLLPAGDVRKYINPGHLFEVNIEHVSAQKRAALNHFRTQTTKFYAWQTRPNLPAQLLDEVSQTAELFLRYDASAPGAAIFERNVTWIRVAHRFEPFMKKKKDQALALWARGLGRNDEKGA
jgi:LmbE family N-acetylglucosaminyl deacetylase